MHRSHSYVRRLAPLLALIVQSTAFPQTEPMYMLKFNWMRCTTERDVVDLANALSRSEYLKVAAEKVITGACTKPGMPIYRVTAVSEQQTSIGRTYYCFNLMIPETDPESTDGRFKEVVEKDRVCVPPFMLTTVDAELSSRTGDFDIIVDGEYRVNARCLEGGRVQLHKEDGVLLRTVFDLPWKRPRLITDVPAGHDISKAIRDGCRGVDVQ